MRQAVADGADQREAWEELMADYGDAHPGKGARYRRWRDRAPVEGSTEVLPTFEAGEQLATRKASGLTLSKLAPDVGYLVGGSAVLTGSNKTDVTGRADFQRDRPDGRYFRFGVHEHAMAGTINGVALHGGLQPSGGTFLIFSDYLRPSLHLSAESRMDVAVYQESETDSRTYARSSIGRATES